MPNISLKEDNRKSGDLPVLAPCRCQSGPVRNHQSYQRSASLPFACQCLLLGNRREYRWVGSPNVSEIQTLSLFNLLDEFQLFLNLPTVDGKSLRQFQLPSHGCSPFALTAGEHIPTHMNHYWPDCGQRWFGL